MEERQYNMKMHLIRNKEDLALDINKINSSWNIWCGSRATRIRFTDNIKEVTCMICLKNYNNKLKEKKE